MHSSQLVRRSHVEFSKGEGAGLEAGLFLRGDAVREATSASTAVALLHLDRWLCSVTPDVQRRSTCGWAMVAAVTDRLSDEAAMVVWCFD